MTRDEFEQAIVQARCCGGYGLDPFFTSFLSHDQAQRAVIEQQAKEIEDLKSQCEQWKYRWQVVNDCYAENISIAGKKNQALREALRDVMKGFSNCMKYEGNADWAINERLGKARRALGDGGA